jgi:hypothetical protein
MSFRRLAIHLTLALGLVTGVASTAGATSILFNGGFETGDFSGWIQGGNTGSTGVECPGVSGAQGNCDAFLGPVGSNGTLSQLLTTVPGQSYTISFALANDGGTPSFFSAAFGGATLVSQTNLPASTYQLLTFVQTATSTSTNLLFTFRNDPAFLRLDAVSVEATTAVPEPMTLSLVAVGLAGGVLKLRKRSVRS